MLGHPKYSRGDIITFDAKDRNGNELHVTGKIRVVDAYGTFFQDEEPSYDAYDEANEILYKHIRESWIQSVERSMDD